MKRALTLLLAAILTLTMGVGTVAHAMEPVISFDNVAAAEMGHTPGDADQVPADSDKGYPHHHAECHGHQIGEPERACASPIVFRSTLRIPPAEFARLAPTPISPENRPPIA